MDADVVLAIGTRLQDFTTGSHALCSRRHKLLSLNVQCATTPTNGVAASGLLADAQTGPGASWNKRLTGDWAADAADWTTRAQQRIRALARQRVHHRTHHRRIHEGHVLPYDAEVIGAVRDSAH